MIRIHRRSRWRDARRSRAGSCRNTKASCFGANKFSDLDFSIIFSESEQPRSHMLCLREPPLLASYPVAACDWTVLERQPRWSSTISVTFTTDELKGGARSRRTEAMVQAEDTGRGLIYFSSATQRAVSMPSSRITSGSVSTGKHPAWRWLLPVTLLSICGSTETCGIPGIMAIARDSQFNHRPRLTGPEA
jgi:hypothetical protein